MAFCRTCRRSKRITPICSNERWDAARFQLERRQALLARPSAARENRVRTRYDLTRRFSLTETNLRDKNSHLDRWLRIHTPAPLNSMEVRPVRMHATHSALDLLEMRIALNFDFRKQQHQRTFEKIVYLWKHRQHVVRCDVAIKSSLILPFLGEHEAPRIFSVFMQRIV